MEPSCTAADAAVINLDAANTIVDLGSSSKTPAADPKHTGPLLLTLYV
jgi:hypothetical protein